jgi:transposase
MMKKNPEREASLIDEWKKGTPAREAARITGVPEGTVYYYWKRFNRDPEKANRLATSLKPRKKLSDLDIIRQTDKIRLGEKVQAKFDSLMKEEKFVQADYYMRAQHQAERYRNEQKQGLNSILALYLADPEGYAGQILDAAREMLQREMDKGVAFLDAVSLSEQSAVAMAYIMHHPDGGAKLVTVLELLKNNYLTEQAAKKARRLGEEVLGPGAPQRAAETSLGGLSGPSGQARKREKRISLDEAARVVVEEGRKEFEMMQREAKAKGQILTFTPITFLPSPTPQRPDSAHPAERLDSNAGKKPNKLPGDRPTKKPGPSDTTG